MPNIRILAKAVLQIFCSQGCAIYKMPVSEKGDILFTRLCHIKMPESEKGE